MGILVLNGSARTEGSNTEVLTHQVLEGLPYNEVVLREKRILPINDLRHTDGGFVPVDDDYDEVIQQVLSHDTLIFVSPVYWYTVTGLMKNFIDRWSQSLRDKRFDFKAVMASKTAYVLTAGGDNPKVKALPMIQQLKYTFDFVGMPLEAYIIAKASKPGDIAKDTKALDEAKWLNAKLKELSASE